VRKNNLKKCLASWTIDWFQVENN